ncbi:MAG TPA: DUF1684 domain-containing protein [Gaiellaceae bacterium]|nr:DUF1684 domain-containing protein [Gaiellaceae bacterium]
MTLGAADALDLLDWKRQVFALYEHVRASSDPRSAWELWRTTRDRLFREHPQSPLPAEWRADFPGCDYFEYDPRARVLARVEPSEPVHCNVVASSGAAFPFSRIGRARFALAGAKHSLALLWNEGYGGGLFVSFQDETSGLEAYPGARYLLDTVKGADLGSNGGLLVLDFNFAYNPSCAYDSTWVCPLAPPEGRLPVPVLAGEQAPRRSSS